MTTRHQRAAIAKETLEIIKRGFYENQKGETIDIRSSLIAAKQGSIHYRSENFDSVITGAYSQQVAGRFIAYKVPRVEITNETTLSAANRLINEEGLRTLCLNFASAKNPGGGFLNGSQAQEESLARASGLYPCIAQMTAMYEKNRNLGSSLYTDDMIYSPLVPVFRDDEDRLLDKPFLVSILTAPAVNAGAVRQKGKTAEVARIKKTMLARTEKLLSVAVVNHHDVLVLGAWGCGVFKNDPHDVARCFYDHLMENPLFVGLFYKIVFAVLDNSTDSTTIGAFREVFDRSCLK